MRTSVLYPALAVALVAGAACKGPDSPDTAFNNFQLVARGSNVIPTGTGDTTAVVTGTMAGGSTLTISYAVGKLPGGATTIDSVFLYTMGAGAANYTVSNTNIANTTYVALSARVCGSSIGTGTTGLAGVLPSACAASTSITVQPTTVTNANQTTTTNTAVSLSSSIRNYGQQLVFFTSGNFYKRGSLRGTP